MFANITVDKKAVRNKSFTYKIPDKLRAKPGSLVLVPFHGQRIVGVVNSLQKDKSTRYKIKKIESIIYPSALLSQNQLKLVHFIAKKYYAPLSSVIFTMVPQYLRKIRRAQTIDKIIDYPAVIPAKLVLDRDRGAGIYRPVSSEDERFRVKHGMTNKKYLLLDPQNKYTLKIYQKAIKSTLDRGQSVLLLVPDSSLYLIRQVKLLSRKSLILDKSGCTDKEIFLKWQMIREGKYNLVIGSHLALFAPLENLGLVIVHEERNQYYKNEQLPKYHLREVAVELARLNKSNLILQAQIPSLESYLTLKNKKLILIPYRHLPNRLKSKGRLKLIDLKQERGLLSLQTLKIIETNLKNKKRTLLFLNRKGFSRFYICSDCGFSKHLESTESAPTLRSESRPLQSVGTPALCPDCQSLNTREHSFGTRRLEFEIKKLFPQAKVLRLDKENEPILNLKSKILNQDIVIATSYIFKFDLIFDTAIIILAEIGLSLPDFRSEENQFYTLFRALQLGQEKIIQTFYPEHRVIKYLLQDDFKTFAEEELKIREDNNYPPFATLIRLTYEGKNAKKDAKKLAKLLKKLNPSYNSPNQILGPAPVFIQPKAGNKYEIILKGKNPYPLLSLVPDKWKTDVGPVELLQ